MKRLDPDSSVPLYLQFRDLLREQIILGDVRDYLPKEQDLCRQYNLSRRTVARAVNMLAEAGLVRRIKSKGTVITGEKKSASHGHIGVVFPITDAWLEALESMQKEASRLGRMLVVYPYDWFDVKNERRSVMIAKDNCDGLILYPNGDGADRDLIIELRQSGFPVVLFDLFYEECECSFVTMNNFLCGSLMTETLIQSPKDRIAIIEAFQVRRHISVLKRAEGFQKTLERFQVPFDNRLELQLFSFDPQENREQITAFLKNTSPDGVFITDQNCIPFGLFESPEFKHIRVSTIGLRTNYAAFRNSRFDFAEQPEEEIGRAAVSLLDTQIHDYTSPARGVYISPRFHWHKTDR